MTPAEFVLGLLGGERTCIADVGAADGLAKRWRPVAPVLRVVAFEPAARSEASGNAGFGADTLVVPRAAATCDGEAALFLTRPPRCSSLRRPNRSVVDRYPDGARYDVLGTATVPRNTLIVTNTFGFHRRGPMTVKGAVRRSLRVDFRSNPFHL